MGENTKVDEQRSSAERIREQIRHTESDITQTVHTIEERLSPRYLKRRGLRKAKLYAWQGVAKMLDLAQRTSVQASLIGGSAVLMLLGNRRVRTKVTARVSRKPIVEVHPAGAAAKAVGAGALWLLMRKLGIGKEAAARKPPVSGLALAATVAKAFLSGKRASEKSGSTREGKKVAWRGLATTIGAALGNYWYTHKTHRV